MSSIQTMCCDVGSHQVQQLTEAANPSASQEDVERQGMSGSSKESGSSQKEKRIFLLQFSTSARPSQLCLRGEGAL